MACLLFFAGVLVSALNAAAMEFPPTLRGRLQEDVHSTRIGCAISVTLAHLAGPDRPHWVLIDRGGRGPIAEFHEPDEIAFDSTRLFGTATLPAASEETVAGFVVHEETHALAYRLHLAGRFPHYDPRTKLNEALAYFAQGLFIDEWRSQGREYRERRGIAPWNERILEATRELRRIGIDDAMPRQKALDLLTEAQFDASGGPQLQNVLQLQRMYEFIEQSGARRELWAMTKESAPQEQSTLTVIARVRDDVGALDFSFSRTFAFMRDRIPLYSADPEFPAGLKDGRPYFEDFERALDFGSCVPQRG